MKLPRGVQGIVALNIPRYVRVVLTQTHPSTMIVGGAAAGGVLLCSCDAQQLEVPLCLLTATWQGPTSGGRTGAQG